MRGGGAIENQTRIDGFDVPNPNHFGAQGGTGSTLSILPPWLIAHGSLEIGGYSVAYGDRMSSVADVGLQPGRPIAFHAMLGAGVGGAMGFAEGPMGASGASGAWIVSARRSLLEAVFRDETAEAIPRYADALVRVNRTAGARHAITFLGLGAKDGVDVRDERTGEEITGDEVVGLAGLRLDYRRRPAARRRRSPRASDRARWTSRRWTARSSTRSTGAGRPNCASGATCAAQHTSRECSRGRMPISYSDLTARTMRIRWVAPTISHPGNALAKR